MKLLKQFGIFLFAALALTACVDKDPDFQDFPDPDVDFAYHVDGDQYVLDYYVVSTIQFVNKSVKEGPITWNFGDGQTSNEANPKHKYTTAGLYKVTLTIDGVGSRSYSLLIYDIIPKLAINSQSTEIIEFNNTLVDFSLSLPNPENKVVKYVWTFPEGTVDANGQPLTTFEGFAHEDGSIDYPGKVKFSNIGSQKVEITSYFDVNGENRRLEDTYLNVQVGCSVPASTLYYAQRDGNIKALKLLDPASLPAGTKVLPYDLGVKSGAMPFQIVYAPTPTGSDDSGNTVNEDWIYILDAGKQYYYVNDESGTLGDGQITAMRADGTGVNTMITNVGQYAFSDPFQGFADATDLYYTDRNTGFSKIPLTTRGAVEPMISTGLGRSNLVIENSKLPYYNKGITFGAISTGIYRDASGLWWMGKCYNGYGIFRFKEGSSEEFPIVVDGKTIKAFTLDETRKMLYVWITGTGGGFYAYELPASDKKEGEPIASFELDADPINTTASEGVFTTQFAVDPENGRCYFGFRPLGDNKYNLGAGVVYYDPETQKLVKYGDTNDLILGITINPNKTKLF